MLILKLYCLDDDHGNLDWSKKKHISNTLAGVKTLRDAVEQLRPEIENILKTKYELIKQRLVFKNDTVKYFFNKPIPAYSGTNCWYLNVDVCTNDEGIFMQAHFLLVQPMNGK